MFGIKMKNKMKALYKFIKLNSMLALFNYKSKERKLDAVTSIRLLNL